MWAGVWSWVADIIYRVWGYYKSQPVAKPSTEAATAAPDEKVDAVCESVMESDLWDAVQEREKGS